MKQPSLYRRLKIPCTSVRRCLTEFDFPGAAEALSEFNAMLEQNDRGTEETRHENEHGRRRSIADREDEVVDDLPAKLESTSPPFPGTTRIGKWNLLTEDFVLQHDRHRQHRERTWINDDEEPSAKYHLHVNILLIEDRSTHSYLDTRS